MVLLNGSTQDTCNIQTFKMTDPTTEIRKLKAYHLFKLGQILNIDHAWKEVMAVIPEDPMNFESPAKYSNDSVRLIESAGNGKHNWTEILLDEWGTSGRVRPNVRTLLEVLIRANLYRAADYVAMEILQIPPPERPAGGPEAPVPIPPAPMPQDIGDDIPHYYYCLLSEITNNFDETPLKKYMGHDDVQYEGHKLGKGGFGSVYLGKMSNGRKVAVKKLEEADSLMLQFMNELKTLSEYRHDNLVPLIGYSYDPPNYCLIYEFMPNGSLLDRLHVNNNKFTAEVNGGESNNPGNVVIEAPLSWQKRIDIAIDAAEGINFLHYSKSTPLVHRDIKSANILLDENLTAKVGDFGLVKSNFSQSKSKIITENVVGTTAYMPPEAFRGDVSVKMDVYSFGVVLLELLTGLEAYDGNREGKDLVTFIEDVVEDSIAFLLDETAGDWDVHLAEELFNISTDCLETKTKRPLITHVLTRLHRLRENSSDA